MKTRVWHYSLHGGLLKRVLAVMGALAFLGSLDAVAMDPGPQDEAAADAAAPVTVRWEADEAVYEAGPWQLRIAYLNKGTRSEGQEGRLLRDGQPVEPEPEAPLLPTPFGMLKHHGLDRPLAWSISGWNFERVRRSEHVKESPPPEASGVVRVVPSKQAEPVALRVGQVLQVVLQEQAGTAYRWGLADEEPPAGLRLDGRAAAEPSDEEPRRLGGPVTVQFDFTAVGAGQGSLRFVLRRSFEPDAPPAEECTFEVTIE